MIFPLIDRIYKYDNKECIVWQLKLFRKVLYRTVVDNGASNWESVSWWKFMKNAKYIGKYNENIF